MSSKDEGLCYSSGEYPTLVLHDHYPLSADDLEAFDEAFHNAANNDVLDNPDTYRKIGRITGVCSRNVMKSDDPKEFVNIPCYDDDGNRYIHVKVCGWSGDGP